MTRLHTIARTLKWIVAITLVALTLAAAYVGHIDPRRCSWPAVLGLAYPLLVAVDAVAMALWIVMRRWRPAATLAVALALTWPALRVNVPLHPLAPSVDPTADTLRVVAFNVNGFIEANRDTSRMHESLRYILTSGAHVVIMPEVAEHVRPLDSTVVMRPYLARLDSVFPYRCHSDDDVTIFSRYPFTRVEVTPPITGYDVLTYYKRISHHYCLAFDLDLPGGRQLRMMGVYLHSFGLSTRDRHILRRANDPDTVPAGMNDTLWRMSIVDKLRRAYVLRADEAHAVRDVLDHSPRNVILLGDFNDTPGSYAYRTISGPDMRDAYADAATRPAHTYRRYGFLVHIDHILYRGDLRAIRCDVPHHGTSDHYPITATFTWLTP